MARTTRIHSNPRFPRHPRLIFFRQQVFLKKGRAGNAYDSTSWKKEALETPTTALPGKRKACRTLRRHFLKKGSPENAYDSTS